MLKTIFKPLLIILHRPMLAVAMFSLLTIGGTVAVIQVYNNAVRSDIGGTTAKSSDNPIEGIINDVTNKPSDDSKKQTSEATSKPSAVDSKKTVTSSAPAAKSPPKTDSGTTVPSIPSAPAAPCPNGTHSPGGPDDMGGCWPYEGNTGVPVGTALSAYGGPCIITVANTVIDKKTVNCTLDIRAQNVTITKSQINGAILVDGGRCATASFSVSDSRIHVSDINYRGLLYCSYTATRVNVTGGQSMAWCQSCTIQDSYLHEPLEDPAGAAANQAAHNSTVRVSSNAIIKHNTLWCQVREYQQPNGLDSSGCSANQTAYSHDGSPPSYSTIEANLYMPTTGGFCAYGGSTAGDLAAVQYIVFRNNIFKRGTTPSDRGEYVCGYYGAITSFDASRPGNQWINNRYDDGTILNP